MKSILQQMYDNRNLEDVDVDVRIKELKRTARMVLENGCLLTVAELAKVITNYDTDICPFCEKGDRFAKWAEEYHQEFCPFAIAYQVLTPEAEEALPGGDELLTPETKSEYETAAAVANDLAKMINIDDAVRTIAKSGKNHDRGPNWYAKWGGMNFSATFGAGTNSASVKIMEMPSTKYGEVLYSASEYGRHIEIFRAGPWVNRLLAHADELRQANKIEAQEREAEVAAAKLDNFKEVDF